MSGSKWIKLLTMLNTNLPESVQRIYFAQFNVDRNFAFGHT